MAANPFEALGLSPQALAGKTNIQIRKLIKAVGRAMSQVEHPDAGGDQSRFIRVQAALEELDDDGKFSKAKEQFLLPSGKRADKAERLLAQRTQLLRSARGQFRAYLLAMASKDAGPTAMKPGPVTLVMNDAIKNRNPFRSLPLHELSISESDRVVEIRNTRRKVTPRVLVGAITAEQVIASSKGLLKLMEKCQGHTTPSARSQISSRLDVVEVNLPQVGHTAPFVHAAPIINLLGPGLKKGSYLFSLYFREDEPMLYCEGKIINIKPSQK